MQVEALEQRLEKTMREKDAEAQRMVFSLQSSTAQEHSEELSATARKYQHRVRRQPAAS